MMTIINNRQLQEIKIVHDGDFCGDTLAQCPQANPLTAYCRWEGRKMLLKEHLGDLTMVRSHLCKRRTGVKK